MTATDLSTPNTTDDRDQSRPVVALAWPTGRPIYPYTVEELAAGVDVYTRRLKAGSVAEAGDDDAA